MRCLQSYFKLFLSIGFLVGPTILANTPSKSDESDEEKHLFPGTGFFIKNYDPYPADISESWFRNASKLYDAGDLKEALEIFEKFTLRRCDHRMDLDGESILIGPEAIYRAAMIREQIGDWKKAFDHLHLIAEAYVLYDYEIVAESLLRIAEKLATIELPKKWGFLPRLRSPSEDQTRLNKIVKLSKGPKFAPRALMILAEISLQNDKEEEAIDALSRLVNYFPEHHLSEKAYFMLGKIYQGLVSGPSYDQTVTQEALNYFNDYMLLYSRPPERGVGESEKHFEERRKGAEIRKAQARENILQLNEIRGESYLELGKYAEDYGKYYLVRWKELGNKPAKRFYERVLEVSNPSDAATEARARLKKIKLQDD